MNRLQRTANRSVLIGDPDPGRFAWLREILKSRLGWEAQRAGNFDELSKRAADWNKWRFIVVADTLPLSSIRSNVVLHRYFMSLAPGWNNRVGCIVTSDRDPDLTGIQNKPLYLHLKYGASSGAASAVEPAEIADYFRHLDMDWLHNRLPRSREEERRQAAKADSPVYQTDENKGIIQLDLKATLAEIRNLNESIATDRQEIQKLQREREKNLTVLDEFLERL